MKRIQRSLLALTATPPDAWSAALAAADSMTLTALEAVLGGMGSPSKMNSCTCYGLSTEVCNVGGKLRDVPGSVCEMCYAHDRGLYAMPNVKRSHTTRLAAYRRDPIFWSACFTSYLNRKKGKRAGYHRWHDSGDMIDLRHGLFLMLIAAFAPNTRFWIPTKEATIVGGLREHGAVPPNVVLRLSHPMVGKRLAGRGTTSMVLSDGQTVPRGVHECPANTQGYVCNGEKIDCHACWSPRVKCVAYHGE